MATTTSLLQSSATLLVLLLLLLSTSNAVPLSRSLNLMDEGSHEQPQDLNSIQDLALTIKNWENMESVTERMNLEVNDYPGSGANNRHTPRP
ncbi:hypothetical protein QVD17_38926 [Tagetes erecta]|uniref:Uncharacterized protein n=1 Tax=Tagetes erecta TaxID=13708 RepID=A0AAD8NFS9_TARER|nr:hypothetical protein QVD17_38926 [Tagetes erecta]